jgi:pSer/pThr/pTyr-binding forkhead associated (FHA) protein
MILRLQHQRPDGEIDSYYLKPGRRYHIGRGSACEVRILDLKLSRKHCALEFAERGWQAVDLMSTNGCTLNGEQIVGNIPVQPGAVLEAGQTRLTIAAIFDAQAGEPPAAGSTTPSTRARKEIDADHDHTETTAPEPELEQEPLPEGPANAPAKAANSGNEWEPEPNSDALNKTDALIPNPGADDSPIPGATALKSSRPTTRPPTGEVRRPTAVFRAEDLRTDEEQDNLATRLHAQEAYKAPPAPTAPSTTPGTDSQERTFYITVLGRRVGPLTRAAARELKARELKGTLTTTDLEQYPLG